MKELSVVVGGQAGDGIRQAGNLIGRILTRMGYHIFIYEDYPSLIRGGHNFSAIRASEKKIYAHKNSVDLLIALNQDTIQRHTPRLTSNGFVIYDSTNSKYDGTGLGIPFTQITRERRVNPIMRNTIALGAFAALIGAPEEIGYDVLKSRIRKDIETNIQLFKIGYDEAKKVANENLKLEKLSRPALPIFTGNETLALGAVKAGMRLYFAYPMTPASSILHFLAGHEDVFKIFTVHPENEIAVALMAVGASAAGVRSMVGTSGGGFDLMTETLSLTGQTESPVVFVLAQRPGPGTGVPTYTSQGDLDMALSAGHGEFLRIVVAPGDVEETFYLSGLAMNLAWKYQVPVILIVDKHISESTMTTELDETKIKIEGPKKWDGNGKYLRYKFEEDGISPFTPIGSENAIVKINSYEHDEEGLTVEESDKVTAMMDKRLRKEETLKREMENMELVNVFGDSDVVLVTWGSVKGALLEATMELGLKMLQPVILSPFPINEFKRKLGNAKKIIDVENNQTAPFARLLSRYGIVVDKKILKYDGRPFTPEELVRRIKEVL